VSTVGYFWYRRSGKSTDVVPMLCRLLPLWQQDVELRRSRVTPRW